MKDYIDLPRSSKIRFESVPLWWIAFQFDALSTLHHVAEFHASIGKYPGIDDLLADLKLSVAIPNLDLQIAIKAAGAPFPIGWNLQNQLTVKGYIIRVLELDMAVNFVRYLCLPPP